MTGQAAEQRMPNARSMNRRHSIVIVASLTFWAKVEQIAVSGKAAHTGQELGW
jgi:hypothetical protein